MGPGGGESDNDDDGGPRMRRGLRKGRVAEEQQDEGPPPAPAQSVMIYPVVAAAYYGGLPAVGAALRKGGDVDELDPSQNWRPLHAAAFTEQEDVVEYLLKMRAAVDLTGPSGMTALHLAAKDDSFAVADALLSARADASLQDQDGHNAYEIAAANSCAKVLRLLEAYSSGSPEDIAAARLGSGDKSGHAGVAAEQGPEIVAAALGACSHISSMPVVSRVAVAPLSAMIAASRADASGSQAEWSGISDLTCTSSVTGSQAQATQWFGSAVDPDNPVNNPEITIDDLEHMANY